MPTNEAMRAARYAHSHWRGAVGLGQTAALLKAHEKDIEAVADVFDVDLHLPALLAVAEAAREVQLDLRLCWMGLEGADITIRRDFIMRLETILRAALEKLPKETPQ